MYRIFLISALLAGSAIASDVKHYSPAEWRAIMARFTFTPRPDYPSALQYEHIQGSGCFRIHIDPQGKVTTVTVLKSTGYRELDERASRALRYWRAKPGPEFDLDMPITFVPYNHR